MRRLFARLPIAFTPYALIYPLLAAASFLFAQGLKMPISYAVFVFVLFLPLISAFQLILARLTLRAAFRTSALSVPKQAPLHIYAILHNRCPFPLPHLEVLLTLPDKDGVHSCDMQFIMTLLPFSSSRIERNIEFAFRGEYRIGIKCIYVYDFMRAVRIRIPSDCSEDIFVMPRKLTLAPSSRDMRTDLLSANTALRGNDNTELADIRAYETGDNKKLIHWKLSSKSEELLVKDLADTNDTAVRILCDLEPFTKANAASDTPRILEKESADTADLRCTDLVIETAIAAVRRELEAGIPVTLAWFEHGNAVSVQLRSEAELDAHFRRFGAASSDSTEHQIIKLNEMLADEAPGFPIIVTPMLDGKRAEEYMSIPSSVRFSSVCELRLCAPARMFRDSDATNAVGEYIKELSNEGFDIITAQDR